jgi:hypothetical protein
MQERGGRRSVVRGRLLLVRSRSCARSQPTESEMLRFHKLDTFGRPRSAAGRHRLQIAAESRRSRCYAVKRWRPTAWCAAAQPTRFHERRRRFSSAASASSCSGAAGEVTREAFAALLAGRWLRA